MYLRPSEVKQRYNVSHTHLFQLEKDDLLHPIKTTGGHRRYSIDELEKLFGTLVQRDGIGYRLEIYFHTFQELPKVVEIVGHDKPTKEANMAQWGPILDNCDPDKRPCLKMGKYVQVDDPKKVPIQWVSCPPRSIILRGNKETGNIEYTDRFFNAWHKKGESIQFRMEDVMLYLGLDKRRWSDELPCYFAGLSQVDQEIWYELSEGH